MSISYKVTIWKTQVRRDRPNPYRVRWVVEGASKPFSSTFASADAADGFRSELVQARNNGEPFDVATGLPLSKLRAEDQRKKSVSWFKHATDYVDYKWQRVSAHQRVSNAETLVAATCALVPVKDAPNRKVLREALRRWAFNKNSRGTESPADIQRALDWVASVSPPLSDLAEHDTLCGVLDVFARKLDGRPAASTYLARRSAVFYNVLKYAVTKDRLSANPLDDPKLDWAPPKDQRDVVDAVDPRVVGSKEQITGLLAAVSYVGNRQGPRFRAFFGCLYYGMLRPEEATGLTDDDCERPRPVGECCTRAQPVRRWAGRGRIRGRSTTNAG